MPDLVDAGYTSSQDLQQITNVVLCNLLLLTKCSILELDDLIDEPADTL